MTTRTDFIMTISVDHFKQLSLFSPTLNASLQVLGWSLLTVPKMFGGNITNQSLISENDMLNHGQVLLTCPSADVNPQYQSCTSCWFFQFEDSKNRPASQSPWNVSLPNSPLHASLFHSLKNQNFDAADVQAQNSSLPGYSPTNQPTVNAIAFMDAKIPLSYDNSFMKTKE